MIINHMSGGGDYVTPHVALVMDTRTVKYQKKIKQLAKVGDIAYWNGSAIKTVPLSNWKDNLGIPVGVVVIGENFLPDGKARIISLNNMVYNGSENIAWDPNSNEHSENNTPLPDYDSVSITDNVGSTSTGSSSIGILPSDRTDTDEWLNGTQSYVDTLTRYNSLALEWNYPMIPSPYLSDGRFNPTYAVELDGGNALSDFNGLSNTQLLLNEGEQYQAAHACWNYKDAANSNLQWYLPAMGELGFLMPRFQLINQSIQVVGGTSVEDDDFWSSSEGYNGVGVFPENYAWRLWTEVGGPYSFNKDYVCKVRGFTCL